MPTVVTLHDVQHRDLPEFFGPARRSFRRLAYDRAARGAEAVVVDERVRARPGGAGARPRPGPDPRDPARDRPLRVHARVRGARAARPLPGTAVAAQEPRATLPGVRARCGRRAHSSGSSSPAAGSNGSSRCPRASRTSAPCRRRSSHPSTGARPASSSRACTRASASRRSRRWRAAAPSPRRTPARSRRSAATPPSSSTRPTSRRWRQRCSRPTAAATSCASSARAGGAVHVGRDGSTARRRVSRGRAEPRSLNVRVGVSLLTLVPRISGGSETYARELARAPRCGRRARVSRAASAHRRRRRGPAERGRRRVPRLPLDAGTDARDGRRRGPRRSPPRAARRAATSCISRSP